MRRAITMLAYRARNEHAELFRETLLEEIASAIRLLAERNRVIAEGAGGAPVSAALSGRAGAGKVVCIVSGGNIDTDKLVTILQGGVP